MLSFVFIFHFSCSTIPLQNLRLCLRVMKSLTWPSPLITVWITLTERVFKWIHNSLIIGGILSDTVLVTSIINDRCWRPSPPPQPLCAHVRTHHCLHSLPHGRHNYPRACTCKLDSVTWHSATIWTDTWPTAKRRKGGRADSKHHTVMLRHTKSHTFTLLNEIHSHLRRSEANFLSNRFIFDQGAAYL